MLIVLGVLALWTFLLGRTKFGRYVYAIGGNAEAARRAGVNLARIRTLAFMLCVVHRRHRRASSTPRGCGRSRPSLDGGTLVLYAVAAAVIGGTSLFGGRGKAMHGVLGGIVIAAIDNGMGLLGFSAASKYMVTALVLLAAVTIDALARRGRVDGLAKPATSSRASGTGRRRIPSGGRLRTGAGRRFPPMRSTTGAGYCCSIRSPCRTTSRISLRTASR